ncbi:hypothetical protein Bca101_025329 [Brassica carinata]
MFILMVVFAYLFCILLVMIQAVMSLLASAGPLFILLENIMSSIISMLSGPNDESPANVEAAKEWGEKRDEFKKKVSRCVRKSQEML